MYNLVLHPDSLRLGKKVFRYTSQPPQKRLITFEHIKWLPGEEAFSESKTEHHFIATPWVHYQWEEFNQQYPWLMSAIYFTNEPLPERLEAGLTRVSTPYLTNHYQCRPCMSGDVSITQNRPEDPDFAIGFWQEEFNVDGDLLENVWYESTWETACLENDVHPTLLHFMKEKGVEAGKHFDTETIFTYWESLEIEEVLNLPLPNDIVLPDG